LITTPGITHTSLGLDRSALSFTVFFFHPLPFPVKAMSSPEDKAYEIMRELDVNYVLVIFGGLTGYASDGRYSSSGTVPASLLVL